MPRLIAALRAHDDEIDRRLDIIEKELPKDSRATSETIDSHFLRATLINTLRISVMPQNEVPHLRSTTILEI
jgi:hypothetical protein